MIDWINVKVRTTDRSLPTRWTVARATLPRDRFDVHGFNSDLVYVAHKLLIADRANVKMCATNVKNGF